MLPTKPRILTPILIWLVVLTVLKNITFISFIYRHRGGEQPLRPTSSRKLLVIAWSAAGIQSLFETMPASPIGRRHGRPPG